MLNALWIFLGIVVAFYIIMKAPLGGGGEGGPKPDAK